MHLVGALALNALHSPQCGDSLWARSAATGSTTAAATTAASPLSGSSNPQIQSGRAARTASETGDISSVGAIASLAARSLPAGAASATEIGAAGRRAFSACGGNVGAAAHCTGHQQGVGSRGFA